MIGRFSHLRPVHFYVRVLLLILCGPSLVLQNVASAPQPREETAKRPLTHRDYDSWCSIQGQQISRDGRFIAYALNPQDGDGEIVVRNLGTGNEWHSGRGWRQPSAAADISDPAASINYFNQIRRLTRAVFTADSRFALFVIEPAKDEIVKAGKEKKTPAETPKNALGIMDLSNGRVTRIDRVKSFQVPEDGAGFIAYHLEKEAAMKTQDDRQQKSARVSPRTSAQDLAAAEDVVPATRKPRENKKEEGSDLVLRDLAANTDRIFADVVEYSLSRDAKTLIFTVSSKGEERDGVYAITPGGQNAPSALLAGKGRYHQLVWDDDQTQLAFISDHGGIAAGRSTFTLYHWDRKSPKADPIVSSDAPGFRRGYVINEKAPLDFSTDGNRLFLGVSPQPKPEKDAAAEANIDEAVVVDLWHWKDDYIQPMQKARAEQDRNLSYRAVYHLKEKMFVQLADEAMQSISPSADGRWVIGTDDRPYRAAIGWESFGCLSDVYLVNTLDGSRRRLLKRNRFGVTLSPGGEFALFYDGKDWNTISIPEGKLTNLTKNLGTRFWREDNDLPAAPLPYGNAGWVKDDKFVLLYDQSDIWRVAPDGSSAKNMTGGVGRRDKLQFRYVRLDPQEKTIDPDRPLLLRAENQWTFDTGFYREWVDDNRPQKLMMASKNLSNLMKAKDSDVLMLTASRFDEYPDLLVTDSTFRELKKVSDAGAQKEKFLWGRAELVRYRNADGTQLSGVLIKPDNFDPKQKYPMIVSVYERFSPGLHKFIAPSPGVAINPSYYASNGFLILMPDIVYTIGYPGQSALKCVLSAVQAVVDQGFVDEHAIGLHGHSWGGYQVAYILTQTSRFRAAALGAPVANMTSAYGSIRWGTGTPRQYLYESAQSRIGGNLWEYQSRFIENSPLFHIRNLETPVLVVHNDNDEIVPWQQGIEYFLALRRLGKEIYMLNYNGEYHNLRKRQNQKDYTRRMQEYFDHWLKGARKPEWMEKGIPYLWREKERERYPTASDTDEP